jgi:hypothetical protein
MSKELIAIMRYDGTTKRYNRFQVFQSKALVKGVIYLDKNINELPSSVILRKESVAESLEDED